MIFWVFKSCNWSVDAISRAEDSPEDGDITFIRNVGTYRQVYLQHQNPEYHPHKCEKLRSFTGGKGIMNDR
jgi:hypothetical protein